MTGLTDSVPPHVPSNLVFDYDIYESEGHITNPLRSTDWMQTEGVPDIFFTPRNGGHWVFWRYDDVVGCYSDYEIFATAGANIPTTVDTPVLLPHGVDPPDHARYRTLFNPLFSPKVVSNMTASIVSYTNALIDSFADKGACDFVQEFSAKLPTVVFMRLMGLPESELPKFLAWEDKIFRCNDDAEKNAAYASVLRYLTGFLDEKRANPGDDLASFLVRARDNHGELFAPSDVLSMSLLLFMAGLDTVTNTMSSIWLQLARNPELRRSLASDPQRQREAVDELLRVNAMPILMRRATKNAEFHGVTFREGDVVALLGHRANRDPAHFPNADITDLARRPRDHVTFGWGPHKCVGMVLAKNEIEVALEQWLARIPDFEVDEAGITGFRGQIMGFTHLPFRWKPSANA